MGRFCASAPAAGISVRRGFIFAGTAIAAIGIAAGNARSTRAGSNSVAPISVISKAQKAVSIIGIGSVSTGSVNGRQRHR